MVPPQTATQSFGKALETTPLRPATGIEIALRLEYILAERRKSNPAPQDVEMEGEEEDYVNIHDVKDREEDVNHVCRSKAI